MISAKEKSSLLLIYTGGTIGMVRTEAGYAPRAGYLQSYLESLPEDAWAEN